MTSTAMDNLKILIVDDDPMSLKTLARLLAPLNYEIVACSSAKAALAALAKTPSEFVLILSDMMMPEMTGRELLATLKKDPRYTHLPMVMLTSISELPIIAEVIEEGASDYLTKPVNPEQLLTLLTQLIQGR